MCTFVLLIPEGIAKMYLGSLRGCYVSEVCSFFFAFVCETACFGSKYSLDSKHGLRLAVLTEITFCFVFLFTFNAV